MWSSGQVWRADKPIGVWLDDCLEWLELVQAGRARVLPEGRLLLVVSETAMLDSNKGHVYHSTLCLDLAAGELVYLITNVKTSTLGLDFTRIA